MPSAWLCALVGGAAIGLAAALVLVSQGRIAGVSGIFTGILERTPGASWRIAFVVGLVIAGAAAALWTPSSIGVPPRSLAVLAVAGLLVGFGTRLGAGCTSGHGVCGIARLSRRSLIAVPTFMLTGAITVWLARVL